MCHHHLPLVHPQHNLTVSAYYKSPELKITTRKRTSGPSDVSYTNFIPSSPHHQSFRGRRDVHLTPSLSCCMLKPPNACRLLTVKTHKSSVIAREREISARETAVAEREANLASLVAERGGEIPRVSTVQSQLDARKREVIGKRWELYRSTRRSLLRWRDGRIKRSGSTSRIFSTHGACGGSKRRWRQYLWRGRNGWLPRRPIWKRSRAEVLVPCVQMTEEPGHGRDKRIAGTYSNIATLVNRNILRPVQDSTPFAMKRLPPKDWSTTRDTYPGRTREPVRELTHSRLDFAGIFDFELEPADDDSDSKEAHLSQVIPRVDERAICYQTTSQIVYPGFGVKTICAQSTHSPGFCLGPHGTRPFFS